MSCSALRPSGLARESALDCCVDNSFLQIGLLGWPLKTRHPVVGGSMLPSRVYLLVRNFKKSMILKTLHLLPATQIVIHSQPGQRGVENPSEAY